MIKTKNKVRMKKTLKKNLRKRLRRSLRNLMKKKNLMMIFRKKIILIAVLLKDPVQIIMIQIVH